MATSNSNFFIAKNGLAVGNTTSTKAVVDNSGHWIGVPIEDAYARDTANSASSNTIFTQGVDDTQNTDISFATNLAQDAFDYANTISVSSGLVNISDDNTTNNVFYINFTEQTRHTLTSIYTSTENLTYNPASGTLSSKSFNVGPDNNITSSNTSTLSLSSLTVDSIDIALYRSAFYQFQLESGAEFHILNVNIVHNGTNGFINTYGSLTSVESLGTFTVNLTSGFLNLIFTPVYPSTTITYVRSVMAKRSAGIPGGVPLGFLDEPITVYFDAGFVLDPVGTSFDYGTVA